LADLGRIALLVAVHVLVPLHPLFVAPSIAAQLEAIEEMRVIGEQVLPDGQTFLMLAYRQPVDRRRPRRGGYFEQRLNLLNVGTDRPMVLHTTGYNVPDFPFLSEPAKLLGANQLSTEQRYFLPSRRSPENWDHLTIRQAADDHHRLIRALRPMYGETWISTGASKGGMSRSMTIDISAKPDTLVR
jgi:PS-10 peptidase S37